MLSALPEDTVGQILDIMEAAPAATPYTFLGARLLETHSLSDYEKWDMLQKMEQMGGHKPSKLLANMMEFCPTAVPLPFYSEAAPGFADAAWRGGAWESEGALAARADKLWAAHAPSSSAVASVSSTEAVEASSGSLCSR